MANVIGWKAAPASRGTGLTTELNALANGAYSVAGTVFDNTTNLDEYAACHIHLDPLSPAAGAYVTLFLVQTLAATAENPPSATNPGYHASVASMSVDTTASAAKEIATPWFRIPPGKFTLVLLNGTGVALAATNNTVTLYTSDDQVN